ncbi:MAG TPA: hypothetical protein DCX52_03985, partial [Massilia sp.]|nr:hypothetical protein [Massilia sp.]
FNLGIALGAWGGGLIVENLGLMATPPIGAAVVAGALALTTLAGRLDRRDAARNTNPHAQRAAELV